MPPQHSYNKVMLIHNLHAGQGMPLSPFVQDFLGIKHRKSDLHIRKEDYIKKIQEYLKHYHEFNKQVQHLEKK
jgi:hypothetical protein